MLIVADPLIVGPEHVHKGISASAFVGGIEFDDHWREVIPPESSQCDSSWPAQSFLIALAACCPASAEDQCHSEVSENLTSFITTTFSHIGSNGAGLFDFISLYRPRAWGIGQCSGGIELDEIRIVRRHS